MSPIGLRSVEGQEGYKDCFHSLTSMARKWLEDGRSFEEFVAWMESTANVLGPGSYEP